MLTPSLFNGNFDLMDHFFDDPWFGFDDRAFRNMEKKLYGHRAKNVMNTDIKENDAGYELTIDLPGFSKDDVAIDLDNGYLIISAQKGFEQEDEPDKKGESGRYIRHERYAGSCSRSFYVGDEITHEDVKAKFKHGILQIDIPKKDAKQIEQKKRILIEG